ncbi:MAG TPA: AAA family ATPase [Anaerolineae bacterium]|nr:AAA family ATPase [Anaerolineae bacterium]HQM13504.1 AAA family ATPase [Anaerolineae bacterium]
MIERLMMHRFRGIREGKLEDLAKVNLLVGPNNSGKTAVLEMLYLAGVSGRNCGLVLEDGSRFEARAPLRHDIFGYRPLPRLWERHGCGSLWAESPGRVTEAGGLRYQLRNLPDEHPLQQFTLAAPPGEVGQDPRFSTEDAQATALFTLERPRGLPLEMIPRQIGNEVSPEAARMTYLWYPDFVFNQAQREPLDYLAVWASEGIASAPEQVLFFDFHTAHDHFQRRFVDFAYMNIPDWHKKISQALGKVFSDIADGRVNTRPAPGNQMAGYVELPGHKPLLIDHFGDGVRHAFKVLAGLITLAETVDEAHPGLFLWEDPELFMHAASLERLLIEVLDLVRERPIQLFISTQSMETIACLTRYFSERQDSAETLRAFRLGIKEGRLFYATFKYSNLRAWLREGMDPRFWGVADTALSYQLEDRDE